MTSITINRGNDGFGSQLMSIISGLAYSKTQNLNYCHTPLQGLKLLDKSEFQNSDLDVSNLLINNIIKNLGYLNCTDINNCVTYPFCHNIIYFEGVDKYYTEVFLNLLPQAYTLDPPIFYSNTFNIGIHIRRGNDIFTQEDINARIVSNEIYEDLITDLQKIYPTAQIHIFSWTNPNLKINLNNVHFHITNTGDSFLNDFNALVHSDILFVGSSSFSISAGFFCKGIVVCGPQFCKLNVTPIPTKWKKNYKEIIKKENFYV